jgi:hypothetical protein
MHQLLGVIVVGIAQHQAIAVGEGNILGTAHHPGEEGVGDIRNDHGDDVGLVPAQGASQLAGLVASGRHRLQDALAQEFANLGRVVQYMRDGAQRNASQLGDLLHVGHRGVPFPGRLRA